MVASVARTLGGIKANHAGEREGENHICVVEAGTGTGKTVSYLLGAIPVAQQRDCKIVVATATVALQEQLVNKDLPQVVADAGLNVTYILAKGRGRYFCISQAEKRLETQEEMGQMALYEDEQAQQLDPQTLKLYREMYEDFASGRWDGDRDNLVQSLEEDVWRPLTSDHLSCTNRRCEHFSVCPFLKARQALDAVDVTIANHDLVLADLALGGGAILPDPSKTIYVFDEAHHLGDKAMSHFAYSMRLGSTQRWLNSFPSMLNKLTEDCGDHTTLSDCVARMQVPLTEMERDINHWLAFIKTLLERDLKKGEQRLRFSQGLIPDDLKVIAADFAKSAGVVVARIEQMVSVLKDAMDDEIADLEKEPAERWFPILGQQLSRAQNSFWLAQSYAQSQASSGLPTARWVSIIDLGDRLEYECRSSPVSAAQTLDEHLWSACFGAVLTSATLTALGNFSRLNQDLGLPETSSYECLPSPFDYYNNAVLEVPKMQTDPSNPDEHTDEVADYLNRHLPQATATLVLFSAWRQMNRVLELLTPQLKQRLLVQGDLSKQEILSQHKRRIDEGEASIIFGLASFAEGVDLPRQYLTEVIIAKLPFGVPDDPVDATHAEWIESQGGNAFEQCTLPQVSMRLTQATGRLLRTEQDTGSIKILDRRVTTRRYGRRLLDALPPYKRILKQ